MALLLAACCVFRGSRTTEGMSCRTATARGGSIVTTARYQQKMVQLGRAGKDVEVTGLVVGEDVVLTELGVKEAPKRMLDVHKNPLFISILDGVDTMKTMTDKGELPAEYLQAAKGLLIMKTDKVSESTLCSGNCARACGASRREQRKQRGSVSATTRTLRWPHAGARADWFWALGDSRLWARAGARARPAERMVRRGLRVRGAPSKQHSAAAGTSTSAWCSATCTQVRAAARQGGRLQRGRRHGLQRAAHSHLPHHRRGDQQLQAGEPGRASGRSPPCAAFHTSRVRRAPRLPAPRRRSAR